MTTKARRALTATGVGAALAALLASGTSVAGATVPSAAPAVGAPAATADPAIKEALTFAREEERMARDLYAAIAAKYDGARPFSMITRSEQRHFDAIGTLLKRYGVADPSAGKKAGSYANAQIQKLYDGWLSRANGSLKAAYQVGIELEKADIADLKKSIAGNLPADVDSVLGRLLQGSNNHLSAYQRAAAGQLTPGSGMGPGAGQRQGSGPGAGQRPGTGPGAGQRQGMGRGPGGGMGPSGGQRQNCPLASPTT